jgi:osmotically-inducible protein OsmY
MAMALIRRTGLVLGCVGVLQGCIAVVGGAALGGAIVLADRRPTGMQLLDAQIEHNINSALSDRFARQSARIDVTSYDQNVLLAGEVPQDKDRADAEALARGTESVRNVTNELTVGPLGGFNDGSEDTLLSTKVKAALLGVQGLPPEVVKTTATMGSIYLFGKVSAAEADLAKNAASQVSGVKRVVALFEILSPEEYARYLPKAPPPAPESQP